MEPTEAGSALAATALRGQQLCIPNLQPVFSVWKQGINPSYERVKQSVDERLEGLVGDERVLVKVKAADIGLFAAGYGLLLPSVISEDKLPCLLIRLPGGSPMHRTKSWRQWRFTVFGCFYGTMPLTGQIFMVMRWWRRSIANGLSSL